MTPEDVLIFLGLLSALLAVFIAGDIIIRLYYWLKRSRLLHARADRYAGPRRARPYSNCLACEGAEGLGDATLRRHQLYDHGVILWR